MKKNVFFLLLMMLVVFQQANAQFVKNKTKKTPQNWQNLSFEKDSIYGAEVDKAYNFLKGKTPQKKVIVALIGTGVDIEHEDLVNSIWTNPKEKQDNKDNDKDGYIDDLHGWNFLGNAKGEVLDKISREGDREFMRILKKEPTYVEIQNDGKNNLIFDTLKQQFHIAKIKNLAEYNYFRYEIVPESPAAGAGVGCYTSFFFPYYAEMLDKKMKEIYPGKTGDELPPDAFIKAVDKYYPDSLYKVAVNMINFTNSFAKYKSWNALKTMMSKAPALNIETYNKKLNKLLYDDRKLVGDNFLNIKDKKYGNNVLLTENAGMGTMFAGLICGERNNNLGVQGIASNVQLMVLRVEADEVGECYLKDEALAIRYAVDHGADVIQFTKPNTFYPKNQSVWVDEALQYAEKKGVLVVMPMDDFSCDMKDIQFYPQQKISDKKTLTNMITVAASDINGNPLVNCNYSKTQLDLFAPGKDLYSAYTGNTYRSATSSRMAASVVTGVAALIKVYYPQLNGTQIRKLMMDNVTSRAGAEVEKEYRNYSKGPRKYFRGSKVVKDIISFDDLCRTNGIVNAYKCVVEADKMK